MTYIYFNHWQDWYNITLNGMYCHVYTIDSVTLGILVEIVLLIFYFLFSVLLICFSVCTMLPMSLGRIVPMLFFSLLHYNITINPIYNVLILWGLIIENTGLVGLSEQSILNKYLRPSCTNL